MMGDDTEALRERLVDLGAELASEDTALLDVLVRYGRVLQREGQPLPEKLRRKQEGS